MRRTGVGLLACGFLLVGLVWPSAAHACSCIRPVLTRTTVIGNSGEKVPTDVVLRVFLEGGFSPALRREMSREYRLRDETGADVPLQPEVTHTRLDLTPVKPLKPNAKYRLERVYAYTADGVRVDDLRRLTMPAADVRRAWFVEEEFETGSASAGALPKVELDGAAAGTRQGGGDCGPGVWLQAQVVSDAKLARTDIVEIEVKGVGVVATKPADELDGDQLWAGDLLCTADKTTIPDLAEVLVRVAVLGRRGTRETGPWMAVVRKGRALGNRRRPIVPGSVGEWFDAKEVTARAATSNTPPACEHGFEAGVRREATTRGGPWIYEARSSMGWVGGGAMVLVGGDDGSQLLGVAPDGEVTRGPDLLLGSNGVGWADRRGGVFVTREYDNDGVKTRLYATRPNGAVRWDRELEPGDDVFIADGIDRLLVTRGVRGQGYQQVLGWTVVSRAKGRLLERGLSHHEIAAGIGAAAALVGRHFLVAYGTDDRERTLGLVAVSKTGDEVWSKSLPVEVFGPMDAIAAGPRMALVSMGSGGDVELTLIGEAGDIIVGPVDVSAGTTGGDNRKPRIAWDGKVFAVTWETARPEAVYAAAVDTKGRVSPALRLRDGSTAGLATSPTAFITSYTRARGSVELTDLKCRTSPPLGAPQRVVF